MTDNAIWCLRRLYPSGYVPYAEQVGVETIRLEWIEREPVTDAGAFLAHLPRVLAALRAAGIRHGDLTEYAVLTRANRPYLIDFGESRLWNDPRPDKRPEGDEYWLTRAMRKLAGA